MRNAPQSGEWSPRGFPGQRRMVQELLDADRAHEAWKQSGGLERLRSIVAGWRVVPPTIHEPGRFTYSEAIAEPVGNGLRVRPFADFDETPVRDLDREPAALLAAKRLGVMVEIMQRDTGNAATPEKAAESYARNEELRRQTSEIATRLESEGVKAYRRTPFDLFTYFVHSGAVVRQEQFRRIMFLPTVAASVRAPKVKELEAFLEKNPFARMFTFTSGPRTPLPELRERITDFHRELSRLASWMRKKYGVEMVFRSTELGKPEVRQDGSNDAQAGMIERDENGVPTFHVHAHTLVWQKRPMKKHAWTAFLKAVWKKWGWFWDDGKSVRDARELCKYVTKPAAVLELTDAELAELSRQLERLRLVTPLGTLRETIKDRREREMRLDKQPTPDGRVFREVEDWNRFGKEPETDAKGQRLRDAFKLRSACEIPDDVPARIVARLTPAFAPGSLIAEPRVCVLAIGWKQSEVERHPFVTQLRDATAGEWSAGLRMTESADVCARASARACALRVHVSTLTVPDDSPDPPGLPGLGAESGVPAGLESRN